MKTKGHATMTQAMTTNRDAAAALTGVLLLASVSLGPDAPFVA